jgi:nucleoid DNA-binding protein
MSRTKIDWRSASKANYVDFCKKHPQIELSFIEWKNVVYIYNDYFRNYILESGDRVKMPFGFGDFSINKKKRKKRVSTKDGKEYVNLPVDWQESKKRGKRIYNFNYHTDGYFFGWHWFKDSARFKQPKLWYFKPARTTSRLINHYLVTDSKYQHLYKEWVK